MQNEQLSFKERQRLAKAPLQYALFKGVRGKHGALRINLKKAYADDNRSKDDGCIFLEMAPAIGPNVYDWENGKIIMSLSVTDIPKIIAYLRNPNHNMFSKTEGSLNLYHDKGAGTADRNKNTTALTVTLPEGYINFMFNINQSRDGQNRSASVPVSPDEAIAIGTLLTAAIPVILAWG